MVMELSTTVLFNLPLTPSSKIIKVFKLELVLVSEKEHKEALVEATGNILVYERRVAKLEMSVYVLKAQELMKF